MYAALLANVARYLTLTPSEQAYVTSLFVAAHVPRFGYVLQAGQPTRSLTFVTRGCLRTYAQGNVVGALRLRQRRQKFQLRLVVLIQGMAEAEEFFHRGGGK